MEFYVAFIYIWPFIITLSSEVWWSRRVSRWWFCLIWRSENLNTENMNKRFCWALKKVWSYFTQTSHWKRTKLLEFYRPNCSERLSACFLIDRLRLSFICCRSSNVCCRSSRAQGAHSVAPRWFSSSVFSEERHRRRASCFSGRFLWNIIKY